MSAGGPSRDVIEAGFHVRRRRGDRRHRQDGRSNRSGRRGRGYRFHDLHHWPPTGAVSIPVLSRIRISTSGLRSQAPSALRSWTRAPPAGMTPRSRSRANGSQCRSRARRSPNSEFTCALVSLTNRTNQAEFRDDVATLFAVGFGPDTDADGVADNADQCPSAPGPPPTGCATATATPTPAPAPTRPGTLSLRAVPTRISVGKQGRLSFGVTCYAGPCTGTISLTAKQGRKTVELASASYTVAQDKKATIRLRLTASARRIVKKGGLEDARSQRTATAFRSGSRQPTKGRPGSAIDHVVAGHGCPRTLWSLSAAAKASR